MGSGSGSVDESGTPGATGGRACSAAWPCGEALPAGSRDGPYGERCLRGRGCVPIRSSAGTGRPQRCLPSGGRCCGRCPCRVPERGGSRVGCWAQEAAGHPVLGLSSPSAGMGGAGGFPCRGERGGSGWGPGPRLTCAEPARAQPTAPHRHGLGRGGGGSPLPRSRGARRALTPARAGGSSGVPPRAGLAPAPLLFTGNEATGWRFGHAAPRTYGTAHSTRASAPTDIPSTPQSHQEQRDRVGTRCPRDTPPSR